jgi:hypothetical protein
MHTGRFQAILPAGSKPKTRAESLPPRLNGETVSVKDLSERDRIQMWLVFSKYYHHVSRKKFLTDLKDKSDVILLRDLASSDVVGFSTLTTYHRNHQGRDFVVIFSGDTVIEKAYWGQTKLHSQFVRYLIACKLANPFTPVYWFLISKGYKTYLLLSRNFPEYWPRHDLDTPAWQQEVIASLASERFGDDFDSEKGIVAYESHGAVCENVAPIGEEMLKKNDIRFFAERNPNHTLGHELCCLGRVDLGIVMAMAKKWVRNLRRRG